MPNVPAAKFVTPSKYARKKFGEYVVEKLNNGRRNQCLEECTINYTYLNLCRRNKIYHVNMTMSTVLSTVGESVCTNDMAGHKKENGNRSTRLNDFVLRLTGL